MAASASTLSAESARALLPAPFSSSITTTDSSSTSSSLDPSFELIAQGAESLLFRTTFLTPTTPAALKFRPAKPWRHPTLDKRLTRARILAEARVLVKCRREGVRVPAVYALDWEAGWMMSEWIEGRTVKEGLRRWDGEMRERQTRQIRKRENKTTNVSEEVGRARGPVEGGAEEGQEIKGGQADSSDDHKSEDEAAEAYLKATLAGMGRLVGQLHAAGVIHGDLTTSNMMLSDRMPDTPESASTRHEMIGTDKDIDERLVLIDFGLAQQSVSEEDRAVDLYVLERAFGSTHPRQEHYFEHVLAAYGTKMGKAGKTVLRKLEDVRMRGRKKSMLG